jgi:hypothetical protein
VTKKAGGHFRPPAGNVIRSFAVVFLYHGVDLAFATLEARFPP